MRCPACGGGGLIHDIRDHPVILFNETKGVAKALKGEFCLECGEVILDKTEAQRYYDLLAKFRKQAMKDSREPHFVTQVREKLGMDRRQAAQFFGLGVNAFTRFETGKTKPPQVLLKLLTLLDQDPSLIEKIK